ncbi:MAG: hypothetical protein AB1540_05700 [Bdellovibrionota bacterium]
MRLCNLSLKSIFQFALILSFTVTFATGCGKPKKPQEEGFTGSNTVDVGNVNAVISETLGRLQGRWVKEIPDPDTANPPSMRLFPKADNVLSGRLLLASEYPDTGLEFTVEEHSDGQFTATLRDDETRTHAWIPKERIFNGNFDAEKREFNFQTSDGEYLKWALHEDPEVKYTLYFSASLYRCIFVAPPPPDPSPAPGGGTTPTPAVPTPAPSDDDNDDFFAPATAFAWRAVAPIRPRGRHGLPARAIALPSGISVPVARLSNCGLLGNYRDEWSRMSGSPRE